MKEKNGLLQMSHVIHEDYDNMYAYSVCIYIKWLFRELNQIQGHKMSAYSPANIYA